MRNPVIKRDQLSGWAFQEICELCGDSLTYSGDNWDGLCPCCADRVSMHLDANGFSEEDRDKAIEVLKRTPAGKS